MHNDVIAQFYEEAAVSVDYLATRLVDLAARFRGHGIDDAHRDLPAVVAELGQFVTMLDVLQGTLGIEPAALVVNDSAIADQTADLARWTEALITAQEQEDWLTLADVLDLDVEPLVRAWGPHLRALREGRTEPA